MKALQRDDDILSAVDVGCLPVPYTSPICNSPGNNYRCCQSVQGSIFLDARPYPPKTSQRRAACLFATVHKRLYCVRRSLDIAGSICGGIGRSSVSRQTRSAYSKVREFFFVARRFLSSNNRMSAICHGVDWRSRLHGDFHRYTRKASKDICLYDLAGLREQSIVRMFLN